MNERERLLRQLSSVQFAAWELHMYLDTHKNDREARRIYNLKLARANELKMEFESKYGPLTINNENTDEWLCDPWPWEPKEDC